MIKYLELTAPEKSEFRQAKILSIKVSEGDLVEIGDPLFKVKSGKNKIDLPSTMKGKIAEVIALVDENISVLTPLVLLETEVETSTATPPINIEPEPVAYKKTVINKESTAVEEPSADRETSATKKKKTKKLNKRQAKKASEKAHQQQNLDLGSDSNSEQITTDDAEAELEVESKIETPHALPDTQGNNTMSNIQVTVPDIGADSAKVIEILVNVGDEVDVDDSLVTLESDKASMDVPSTAAGIVTSIAVTVDQDVSEGSVLIDLTTESATEPMAEQNTEAQTPAAQPESETSAEVAPQAVSQLVEVTIPDIGGDSAKVIEILVEVGQTIAAEESLVTLESDKASMDVPSSVSGTIDSIDVSVDQDVSEGMLLVKVLSDSPATTGSPAKTQSSPTEPTPPTASAPVSSAAKAETAPATQLAPVTGKSHASPSIRRFARELGVDLSKVGGSGRKGRIVQSDVKAFVKSIMLSGPAAGAGTSGGGIPDIPAIDFTKFGEIDIQPLNRIKKLTAKNLHRAWLNIPHVTHNDESNISDLDTFRKQLNTEYAAQNKGIKLSPLAFIVKAVVNALRTYPQFNSSLEPGGENLIFKKYIHIGIAVETPNGLVVPVIRNADKMSISDIALAMGELAAKARDKKLSPADMSGASFTISSLGGIGGTSFTPIVNAPEVAILGVSRSKMQPVWNGKEFEPGMILPLSLSYDHRIIDGAEAARFTAHIAAALEDVRRLTV